MLTGLATAPHPRSIHTTSIGTGTELSTLSIANNLQSNHSLQMFVLINDQKWIPSLFKRKIQKDRLAFVFASDFPHDVQNTHSFTDRNKEN